MKKKKSSSNTVLNTTVMTDVLFILLTFFVLVSTVKKDAIQVQAAKVDKQPNPQEMQKKTEQYVLTIDQKKSNLSQWQTSRKSRSTAGCFEYHQREKRHRGHPCHPIATRCWIQ